MIVIDGSNQILGRLCNFIAKKSLLGEKIAVLNSEKVVVIGKPVTVLKHYEDKYNKGNIVKGPFFPRRADLILKRSIRGMLPIRTARGRKAYENVMCYFGVPDEFKGKDTVTVPQAKYEMNEPAVSLREISEYLGYNYKLN